MTNEKLLDKVNNVVQELPPTSVESMISWLREDRSHYDQRVRSDLLALIQYPRFRHLVLHLTDALDDMVLKPTCSELAAMLATASYCEKRNSQNSAQLVWTGPEPDGTSLRRTGQALLELINDASEELTIISFAIYRIPQIVAALNSALRRNVKVRVIAERSITERTSEILNVEDNLGPFLTNNASIFIWPKHKRPVNTKGKRGILHIKCAVADRSILFISSANLTDNALRLNMEMGLLLRHRVLAKQVADHVDGLVANHVFQQLRASVNEEDL
jgi:phosphatidylserine/phosphatidylglycerophosphate/cardiolipin synthase-like enzyme